MRTVLRAPVRSRASKIARLPTGVIPEGTQATIRVLTKTDAGTTARIK